MRLLQALAIGAAVLVSACARPTLAGLDVTSGPPHTLVMVDGSDLDEASVLWDNNPIPSGFLGAHMFSVPPGATSGPHTVSLKNSYGNSTASLQFDVKPPVTTYPTPRVDAVTLAGASFDSPGHVTAALYVQGANLDVGAVVLLVPLIATAQGTKCPAKVIATINPTELATASHKALRNSLFNLPATEFDYPIRHFLSTVALSGSRTAGETICLAVRNLDLLTSDVVSYKLPVDAATVDSDGDSLPDVWETDGFSGVDLPGTFKTDPYRRDILVQLDVMATGTATLPGLQHPPGLPTFDAARAMFDNAPFLNPNGPPGIHLVLDTHTIPYVAEVCFNIGAPSWCNDAITANPAIKKFSDLKNANPAIASRDKMFHYAIWGAKQTFGPSGQSDWADDFLISFDDKATSFHTVRSQAEGLVHELGHDLGLTHGGGENDDEHVVAHWSVMSYSWDKRTGQSDQWRLDHATCGPVYYRTAGANESSTGAPPMGVGVATDYSLGMGKMLVPPPSNTAPAVKTCGKSINWPLNQRGPDPADWPMITFDGPARQGDLP